MVREGKEKRQMSFRLRDRGRTTMWVYREECDRQEDSTCKGPGAGSGLECWRRLKQSEQGGRARGRW